MRSRRFDIGAVRAISWDVDGTLYSTRRVAPRLWFATLAASLRRSMRSPWEAATEMRRFRKRMERVRAEGGRLTASDASIERRIRLERHWLSPAISAIGARPGVAATLLRHAARSPSRSLRLRVQPQARQPWPGGCLRCDLRRRASGASQAKPRAVQTGSARSRPSPALPAAHRRPTEPRLAGQAVARLATE